MGILKHKFQRARRFFKWIRRVIENSRKGLPFRTIIKRCFDINLSFRERTIEIIQLITKKTVRLSQSIS